MKHLSEHELVMGLLGEAAERDRAARHVAECTPCREQLEEIRASLDATSQTPVPEPDAGFEQRIWRHQRSHLNDVLVTPPPTSESTGGLVTALWSARRLALGGALAASLVLAFVAGLYTPPPGMDIVPRGSAAGGNADRLLLVAVGGHLESARVVLIELANDETMGGTHSTRAEHLLGDNRLYRQTATLNGQTALAEVLEELERVLLEVARSPRSPAEDLEWLRDRIEARDLLFRVSVIERQARKAFDKAPRGVRSNL